MDDLARMSEVTNDRRAQWARGALEAFVRQTGQSIDLPDGDTEVIGDLLCDLHHWADAHDVMWDVALALGEMHYEAERITPPVEALSKIAAHLSGGSGTRGRSRSWPTSCANPDSMCTSHPDEASGPVLLLRLRHGRFRVRCDVGCPVDMDQGDGRGQSWGWMFTSRQHRVEALGGRPGLHPRGRPSSQVDPYWPGQLAHPDLAVLPQRGRFSRRHVPQARTRHKYRAPWTPVGLSRYRAALMARLPSLGLGREH
jgi:hypothetical protein